MVNKSNISGFINNSDLDKKIATLAKNAELKAEQDKTVKLQAFNSIHFCGKSDCQYDGTQIYSVFQPIYKSVKEIVNTDHISACASKKLSEHSIKPLSTYDNSLASSLNYIDFRTKIKLDGHCLKQNKVIFNNKTIVNI